MILGCLEVMAESLTLAEKSGIGAEAATQLIKGGYSHFGSIRDVLINLD
jgi:3-hydroxyisobutyrate dehydrogenase-like beta-hydroxyacid dehydrogenase